MSNRDDLRTRLEAMLRSAPITQASREKGVNYAVALDLLREKEERETPCVWMPTAGGKWSPECSVEAWEPLDTKAKFCPGCGHPVQVNQPQDAAEEG